MTDDATRTDPGAATVTAPGASSGSPARTSTGPRYVDRGRLGRGGMGEVRRVHDQRLKRDLAMKLLDPRLIDSPGARTRFLNEAEITAGLQHPGIVAVHDQGERVDGRLWYTMKIVEGRTFAQVIAAGDWSLRRLVDAFGRVCDAMAYAHEHGVVHRDLKPSNLMIGAFGEVLVMDWGLAFRVGDAVEIDEGGTPADARLTQMGAVLGTLAYMPPEQARGERDRVGPASDVYALGAVLFEILTGEAPFSDGHSALDRLYADDIPDVGERTLGQGRPAELIAACQAAMRPDPAERLGHARVLAQRVRDWLDGARRRERALALVDQARAMTPQIAALRADAARLTTEAGVLLGSLAPHAPEAEKLPGWRLEDEAAERARAARLAEVEYVQTLRGALNIEPTLPEARALLADHHRARLEAAEARHDGDAVAEETALLQAYDTGRHAAWLTGDGAVSLITDPPGAQVTAYRYAEVDRRLQPVRVGVIGTTPLVQVPLSMGSYLLIVEAPGRVPMRYPVLIERQGHWDGGEAPVPLLRPAQIRPDEVYVPAGWFWFGGDPEAADGAPRQRVWVDGFLIGRFPVTNAQYRQFLEALIAAGRVDEARALCPPSEVGPDGDEIPWQVTAAGVMAGPLSIAHWPVTQVDLHGARAFAAWSGGRLPHSAEWEKAARGVDGRFFPWGNRSDQTWARIANSAAGQPTRAPVDGHPTDVSPFGMRGVVGNVRDWCADRYERDGMLNGSWAQPATVTPDDFVMIKGGAWSASIGSCRPARRFAARPEDRFNTLGIRVVRALPAAQVLDVSSASR